MNPCVVSLHCFSYTSSENFDLKITRLPPSVIIFLVTMSPQSSTFGSGTRRSNPTWYGQFRSEPRRWRCCVSSPSGQRPAGCRSVAGPGSCPPSAIRACRCRAARNEILVLNLIGPITTVTYHAEASNLRERNGQQVGEEHPRDSLGAGWRRQGALVRVEPGPVQLTEQRVEREGKVKGCLLVVLFDQGERTQ